MPASADEAMEALLETDERQMEPVTEMPEDAGLYELILQTDQEPEVIRRYRGRDLIPRVVVFISGNVGDPVDGLDAAIHPEMEYTRMLCSDRTDAKNGLEGCLDMGQFERVDGGGD